jgi:hypothetical protein
MGAAVKNISLMTLLGSRPTKCSSPLVLYGSPRFVECPPGLSNIQAGPEAVGRGLPGRRDDRLRLALVHALDDEPEQMPYVTTALGRAGCLVVPVLARFEHGNHLVDHPILGAGQDC